MKILIFTKQVKKGTRKLYIDKYRKENYEINSVIYLGVVQVAVGSQKKSIAALLNLSSKLSLRELNGQFGRKIYKCGNGNS